MFTRPDLFKKFGVPGLGVKVGSEGVFVRDVEIKVEDSR